MGLPFEEDEYGDDCLTCFPAGKTPLYVYVIFSGITKGPLAQLDAPSPPNRMFRCEQMEHDACRWFYEGDEWHIDYRAVDFGDVSRLSATTGIPMLVESFLWWAQPRCKTSGVNWYEDDRSSYYGGSAVILNRLP